jgi:hypothetical protein
MTWWIWMVVGLILAALEVVTPGGLVLIFFGAGAVVAGLLSVAGVASLGVQLLVFALVSVVSLLLLRKPIQSRLHLRGPAEPVDELAGEEAMVSQAIAPGDHGKVELRGATWSAKNVGSRALVAGERCRVMSVHGVLLHVGPAERS